MEIPSSRFHTVHIDIIGPLPPAKCSNNPYINPCRYVLTCIDRTSRWIEAQPISDITAQTVAEAFVNTWITRFGVPLHVISDKGKQFESELFLELSKIIGFYRLRTTSYHPQCNGLIERAHRTIKAAIMARKESWISALSIVLMGIRSMPNCSNFSPFYAVTGAQMLLPQLMINTENTETVTQSFTRGLHKTMAKFDLTDFSNREKSTKTSYAPDQLQTCDKVWIRIDRVRKPLEAPYSGPYMVLERTPKYFLIETNSNTHTQVSIDRLKPYIENKQKCTQNATTNTKKKKSESLPPKKVQEHKMKTRTSGRTVTWKKDNEYIYY